MHDNYVLVTGGSQNIGAAICRRLHADGLKVIVLDIVEPTHDLSTEFCQVDLSDAQATKAVLAQLTDKYEITRLVNNVGIVRPALVEDTKLEDFELLMNLNTRSALICTQALLPTMRRKKFGRIVSNASRVVLGKELRTCYSGSKGALISMSRTWALELAKDGITVNGVAPGPIATNAFWANNPPDSKQAKAILRGIPLQRMGTPEDVANGVAFFIDERSSFVTGQFLYVCGGVTVGLSA
ncbi:SDR family NAD(P)-dependent oxidoreductase [Geopsychrobacter electrodiphilus]|uniref:SDR family NAD(P)-dependent oxidoreductase n=1 Tax=Geopsychrobacter electrodiphilus TaxID=225196 RepID=UPI00037F1B02|nr:SDR family oxidoreductase [Geopsychrobacter electrodiphilus]